MSEFIEIVTDGSKLVVLAALASTVFWRGKRLVALSVSVLALFGSVQLENLRSVKPAATALVKETAPDRNAAANLRKPSVIPASRPVARIDQPTSKGAIPAESVKQVESVILQAEQSEVKTAKPADQDEITTARYKPKGNERVLAACDFGGKAGYGRVTIIQNAKTYSVYQQAADAERRTPNPRNFAKRGLYLYYALNDDETLAGDEPHYLFRGKFIELRNRKGAIARCNIEEHAAETQTTSTAPR